MRKLILLALLPAIVLACGRRAAQPAEEMVVVTEELPNVVDSLILVDGMGDLVVDVFEGIIPAADAPGQLYTLALTHQEKMYSGVYQLTQVFEVDAESVPSTFNSFGRYDVESDNGMTIIAAKDFDGSETAYYMIGSDDSITMLDNEKKPIESENNYTLRKK